MDGLDNEEVVCDDKNSGREKECVCGANGLVLAVGANACEPYSNRAEAKRTETDRDDCLMVLSSSV
jgi:hypothetical protein